MISISANRQREILAEVARLIAERSEDERRIRATCDERIRTSHQQIDAELEKLQSEFECDAKVLDDAYVDGLQKSRHRYEVDLDRVRKEASENAAHMRQRYAHDLESAEHNWRQTRVLTMDSQQTDRKLACEVGDQARTTVAGYEEQLSWLEQRTAEMLRRRGIAANNPPPSTMNVGESTAELLKRYTQSASRAHELMQHVATRRTTRFLDEGWPLLIFFATFVVGIYPFGAFLGWKTWHWLAASGGAAATIAILSRQLVHSVVRRSSRESLQTAETEVADARNAVARAKVTVEREHDIRLRRLDKKHDEQLEQADLAWEQIAAELGREQEEQLGTIRHRQEAAEKQLESRWEGETRPFREDFPPRIESRKAIFEQLRRSLQERRQSELREIESEYQSSWDTMATTFTLGIEAARREVEKMVEYCQEHQPDVHTVDWDHCAFPRDAPSAVQFGEFEVDLGEIEGGLPNDERLRIESKRWTLPAVLAFPESPSLLIEAEDEGRTEAIRVLRHAMLRMLTSFPPGKVRFTIIDPTGLGQNFSEFMHLADYDERLVTNRIWTEANHIAQRLTDLTEHMENVIQKYLRNEFVSIQQYNERAGEVAEPFQVLVIANFPDNFSEETARRLVSIATSGARCGVYTMISVDTKMSLPRNFDLEDLRSQANTLRWDQGRLAWADEQLGHYALRVEPPLEGTALTAAIRAAGENAKDANRVEVPFAAVVPPREAWWTADSRHEVSVSLGRAGATKLQWMRLGKGTSQHVLISGKTGSGKSTLMHAVITNLALHYHPREVEFYLVDFKKGVEFKAYAEQQLPHARVIAIESEREFGMSVLERLDEELRRRGDLFREAGVQSVAGFRDLRPDHPMPRQLLIVDEFQEFFVKDDRIAQDASLLLDRLVRQGRAFGIHVILGSQTLAGAYSLARSTLGQMAVRIALQCSEADAHLILSEDNTAARLLSRPGEAIYNNANGLFEGNHPFQVVWLPDSEREQYLREIGELANTASLTREGIIVFEGNVPADPSENGELRQVLQTRHSRGGRKGVKAWLGAAVAIKPPTHVVFRRQAGCHLLIVGQDETLASGVMTGALISLAAGQPCREGTKQRAARFVMLDGGGFESDQLGLATRLSKLLPLDLECVDMHEVDERVAWLAREVTDRIETGESRESREPIFVAIYNLGRFRSLRKSADDFGLSGFGDDNPESASQQFGVLLREGPAVGVHLLIWCDTYNNVTRWLDRNALREVAHRVLFQMSATDSSNLIDSAAAANLGAMRAILYDDEKGEMERFRPYGEPTREWLEEVATALQATIQGPASY